MRLWSITCNRPKDKGCELVVERTPDPYVGLLVIYDNGLRVVTEDVRLSYGAKFGPDVQDVSDWEKRFERYLDTERQPAYLSRVYTEF